MICKLTDFGFASEVPEQKFDIILGTAYYKAPELYRGDCYDSKVDIWAIGIIAYILLTGGDYPYDGSDEAEIANQVFHKKLDFA